MASTLPPISEADFLSQVVALAKLCGWIIHHQRPARTKRGWRSAIQGVAGFPDLVLCRPPRIIFAELKSESGQLSPYQETWHMALNLTGMRVRVWRPSDWPEIERELA